MLTIEQAKREAAKIREAVDALNLLIEGAATLGLEVDLYTSEYARINGARFDHLDVTVTLTLVSGGITVG